MTTIALLGASGKMGQAIQALVGSAEFADFEIAATWSAEDSVSDLPRALRCAQVAIDFTMQDAQRTITSALREYPLPLVSGTTGLSQDDMAAFDTLAKQMPVFHDGNMSVGIAVLTQLVREATAQLTGYDVEISDVHHRDKRDAPSGTALQLGQAVAEQRGDRLTDVTRPSDGARTEAGQIGFSATRGGSVIGEHTVAFLGDYDRIQITHTASDRRLYAAGALRAAAWLVQQPNGRYRIADLLA